MSKRKKDPDRVPEGFEIESLNLENLDVEELERRVELVVGVPIDFGDLGIWCDCNNDHDCGCNSYTQTCDTDNCSGADCGCYDYCGQYCAELSGGCITLGGCTCDNIAV